MSLVEQREAIERRAAADGMVIAAWWDELDVSGGSGGSITGGFDVILRITPGAELADVAAAYADQANQFEGEPIPAPEGIERGSTTVRVLRPPGGAGGYRGEVIAVDQAAPRTTTSSTRSPTTERRREEWAAWQRSTRTPTSSAEPGSPAWTCPARRSVTATCGG